MNFNLPEKVTGRFCLRQESSCPLRLVLEMSKPSLAQTKSAADESQPAAPAILVVDDTEAIRIVLRMQLKILGYRVLEARSGQEAIELCGREHPDLILMDISMPHLDGLGTTRLLRQAAETRYIPVVAISAFHGSDFRECALAAGCNDFVAKPVAVTNLDEIIARNLKTRSDT